MSEVSLKKDYYNAKNQQSAKEQFIRDFVEFCRHMKRRAKYDGRGMAMFINKFVTVCGECWQFQISASVDTVWTEAHLFHFDYRTNPPTDISTHFPKTRWGGPFSRWDFELREFLSREVNKG